MEQAPAPQSPAKRPPPSRPRRRKLPAKNADEAPKETDKPTTPAKKKRQPIPKPSQTDTAAFKDNKGAPQKPANSRPPPRRKSKLKPPATPNNNSGEEGKASPKKKRPQQLPKPQQKKPPTTPTSSKLKKVPPTPVFTPTTKIVIRCLPADIPEHIFWRSIEPALPWFDPQKIGEITKRPMKVVDRESNTVVPKEVDAYTSPNLVKLDAVPYWRLFVTGKKRRSEAKGDVPSRAYILFSSMTEAEHFHKKYHGHAFSRKDTVMTRARVEMAPYQHVPHTVNGKAAVAKDELAGTIDDDPDFVAFVNSQSPPALSAPPPEATPQLLSYAVAAQSSSTENTAATTTPLIAYLKKMKASQPARAKKKPTTPATSSPVESRSTILDKKTRNRRRISKGKTNTGVN